MWTEIFDMKAMKCRGKIKWQKELRKTMSENKSERFISPQEKNFLSYLGLNGRGIAIEIL